MVEPSEPEEDPEKRVVEIDEERARSLLRTLRAMVRADRREGRPSMGPKSAVEKLLGDSTSRYEGRRELIDHGANARQAVIDAILDPRYATAGVFGELRWIDDNVFAGYAPDAGAFLDRLVELSRSPTEEVLETARSILIELRGDSRAAAIRELVAGPALTGSTLYTELDLVRSVESPAEDLLDAALTGWRTHPDNLYRKQAAAYLASAAGRTNDVDLLRSWLPESRDEDGRLSDLGLQLAQGFWLAAEGARLPAGLRRQAGELWFLRVADGGYDSWDAGPEERAQAFQRLDAALEADPSLRERFGASVLEPVMGAPTILAWLRIHGDAPSDEELFALEQRVIESVKTPGFGSPIRGDEGIYAALWADRHRTLDPVARRAALREALDGPAALAETLDGLVYEWFEIDKATIRDRIVAGRGPEKTDPPIVWHHENATYLDGWISNGGLSNVYWQTEALRFRQRIASFEAIGATAAADVIRRADALVGVPEGARSNVDVEVGDSEYKKLGDLDSEFFAQDAEIQRCLLRVLADHADAFRPR